MIPVCDFLRFCTNRKGEPFLLLPHQEQLLRATLTPQGGRFPFAEILHSEPKKSGKTLLAACVGLWAAFEVEVPNEVYFIGNDLGQSRARAFAELCRMATTHPALKPHVVRQTREDLELDNGSLVRALPHDATGEAGAEPGAVFYDEAWGFTSEESERLVAELTLPPTRRLAFTWWSSYAGYEGESKLLRRLYERAMQGEPVPSMADCWSSGSLFALWSGERRAPWQQGKQGLRYYAQQRASLRPSEYRRLHENAWSSGAEAFITAEQLDAITAPDLKPPLPQEAPSALFCGLDASVRRDSTALVAVYWQGEELRLGPVKVWRPSAADPVDFSAIEAELLRWHNAWPLACVTYDPFQLAALAQRLTSEGLPMRELPQTVGNLSEAASTLLDAIQQGRLRLWPSEAVREALLNAVLIEGTRGLRIAKEKTSRKIDAAAALSFAVLEAVRAGAPGAIEIGFLGPMLSSAAWDAPYAADPGESWGQP